MLTGYLLNKFSGRGFTFIAADPEYGVEEDVFLHMDGILKFRRFWGQLGYLAGSACTSITVWRVRRC